MVDSPEYDCQLVLVTKLTAVFHAWSGLTAGKPSESHELVLHPLEQVQEQDRYRREGQHAAGVDAPGLLAVAG